MVEDRLPSKAVDAYDTGRGKVQVEIHASGAVITADEPVEAGGLGSGPTPHQLLYSALAACTIMTLKLYADQKGWPLKRVHVRVLHDGSGAKDRFTREIRLEGPLDADQQQRLREIARRCPVHQTLERSSEVIDHN
jgi:putative redox protein